MPIRDYECGGCGAITEHIDRPGDVLQACSSCSRGRRFLRVRPSSFGIAMRGPSRRTSGAQDAEMWGTEHVAALRTGDAAATREVHYDVMRRSGITSERAKDIARTSAGEGARLAEEHTRNQTGQSADSLRPTVKVAHDG